MIVVLLGPPGSGKGTQAKRLWTRQQWPQVSTGDMLRTAIQSGTKLGLEAKSYMDQGALVPDSVVIGLISERSQQLDCQNGFILDGFPRNISQAEALERMLSSQGRRVDRAVLFEIPDFDLVRRLSGRRTCAACNAMYHVENAPPKSESVCDMCGERLIQRDDDKPEVIEKRLAVYHQQTEPLVGFYEQQGKLSRINAQEKADTVSEALKEALK
jgi:adenylate kinase